MLIFTTQKQAGVQVFLDGTVSLTKQIRSMTRATFQKKEDKAHFFKKYAKSRRMMSQTNLHMAHQIINQGI